MTKLEMAILGKEFDEHYYSKYHVKVTETYKYRGEVRTRTSLKMTDEGEAIIKILEEEKLFTCPICGKKKSYGELEVWDETAEEVAQNQVECALCYEDAMGEDL